MADCVKAVGYVTNLLEIFGIKKEDLGSLATTGKGSIYLEE